MATQSGGGEGGTSILVPSTPLYNLRDVSPDQQGGGYDETYDSYFLAAAKEFRVPFALIKAHAIQESSLNPNSFVNENPNSDPSRAGWASRGLCQILWWYGSNRLARYGYTDEQIGITGGILFDPQANTRIAAQIIATNLNACGGNLRDAINMYNTGKKESDYEAPNGYVDKVFNYYQEILG
ncbi:MAG: transglycosylase SLT domain-containing protein [Herbaspirillum sp.]